MKSHDDSSEIAEALRTYLPELTSPELLERIRERLKRAAAENRAEHGAKFPDRIRERLAEYDASLDSDGLFLDYFRNFVKPWADVVGGAVAAGTVVDERNSIVDDFITNQTELVSRLMTRTLVEQLHLRRSRGLLNGETPQERYSSFRQWTNSAEGHAELLAAYPHLFKSVDRQVESSARYVLHLIREVECHAEELARLVPGHPRGRKVTRISLGQGDTHNGGTAVAEVVFADGSRVLYKPHPLGAEAGYNSFLAWVNERLGTELRTIEVLPTEGGGFVEFVPTQPYAGDEKEYFAKVGRIAGVLFLLKATDIHFENMVTCAEGPVVVDTETLLTPRLRTPEAYDDQAASKLGALALEESIIGSGLLPLVIRSGTSGRGLDIGAIGYDVGQRVPYKSLRLNNPGRDDMFVDMVTTETTAANANLPVHKAARLAVPAQRDIIKAEFRRVLEYAAAHGEDVMEAVDACLGAAEFRHINNPSMFYSQLLRMATHPDAMASPLVRAAVLNRVVLRTGDAPEIADEEVRQMAEGDIPYFSCTARSRTLRARDRIVLADALEETPLDTVRARIRGLDEAVIEQQLRFIDYSFVNKLPTEQEQTEFVPGRRGDAAATVGRARLVREAERIGDQLLATLVPSGEPRHPATWIAPQVTTDSQSQWSPGTLGYDLYGGSPGPALVLAGLAHATGRRDFADAARRVLDPIEAQLRGGLLAEHSLSVGGMTGMSGTVYAIAVARRLLDEPDGTRLGDLTRELARCVSPEVGTDYVSGLAGALAVCMALHDSASSPTEKQAVAQAVKAVAAAEVAALGGTGLTDAQVTQYTGYAHGAMGIGPVLVRYGTKFQDPQVRELGLRIVGAVLDAFDERDRDWPRVWGEQERSYGWCHGAPGLLLGSLDTLPHAPSAVPADALTRLAELTLQRGFGNNPTYCHGDLGSAEIVAFGEQLVPGLFGQVDKNLYPRLFTEVVERHEQRFDTKYAYSNSLLVGQAGLAWSLLRHLDSESYPSILRFS